jgi:beta-glucanase (GH16 family)
MKRLKPFLLISFTVAVFICCGSSDSSSDNDNDGVTPPQQCLAPTALSVTLLNGNTVALEWGAMNGETQWKYVLQSQGMGDPTTEGEDTTTNPLTLTNLNPSSSYEFYIRAVCTDNNLSPWAGPVSFTTTVPEGYVKVWEDHFDGPTINTNYWTVGTLRDPESGDIIPGADGDFLLKDKYSGYVTEEDSYIEDGALVLRNQKRAYEGTDPAGSYDYTSGWAMTMHKVYLNKGYIEMRAQFPSGDKVWPALWLIAEDLVWGPEWDMFEYFGQNVEGDDVMAMHLFVGEWDSPRWSTGFIFNFDQEYDCEAWHIYGFQWTEEKAVWSVDGVVKRELSSDGFWARWPNEDMYLVFNNEVQTYATDQTTEWPNYLKIDYVEIYSNQD